MAKIVLKEKLERREGVHLHLKGERCSSPKCALTRRNYPPGAHGQKSRSRLTAYGAQLREKQKAKRVYGVMERQFRRYFERASRSKGDTKVILSQLLELRLDNALFRLGFSSSRRQARQMINHGHVEVNGGRVTIPSFGLRIGDVITVKESKRSSPLWSNLTDRQTQNVPSWLAANPAVYEGRVVARPEGEDLAAVFDPKLIVEFYSR